MLNSIPLGSFNHGPPARSSQSDLDRLIVPKPAQHPEQSLEDPLQKYVKDIPVEILDPRNRVSEPIAPGTSTTHGAKTLAEFAALKFREAKEVLRPDEAEYFRYGTPITRRVEQALAELDGGEMAVTFRSGMAAIKTLLDAILPAGKEVGHIVVGTEGYRQTRNILERMVSRGQIELDVIPMNRFNDVRQYLKPNTKAVFFETPSNPYLRVIDVRRVKDQIVAAGSKALVIVDHTFAGPLNQKPLEQGADVVVPSLTKYISGNNQVGAGAVIGPRELLLKVREFRGQDGNIAHDHDCLGVEAGLESLAERTERSNRNGLHVAKILADNSSHVLELWYPGHPSHRDHEVARKQMKGFGGVVSFRIDAKDFYHVEAFVDAFIAASGESTFVAPSFGGDYPLISSVPVVSHFQQSQDERKLRGIPNDLIRLSVGTQAPETLERALNTAFAALKWAKLQG